MNRILTLLFAAVIVFGGWTVLKARVLTPQAKAEIPAASKPRPAKVLWTAGSSERQGGGADLHNVFSIGLNRYLGQQVSGASALPLDQIDPAVISQTDDAAELTATVGGIRYRGKLRWEANGWNLVELSREN